MSYIDGVNIEVALTTSQPTISLSASPSTPSLELTVSPHISSLPKRTSAITLCTVGSVHDNGLRERQDDLLTVHLSHYRVPQTRIEQSLAFPSSPEYGSQPSASLSLREEPSMRFETVQPMGQGDLVKKHSLSTDGYQNTPARKAADVRQREKSCIRMTSKRQFSGDWWTFGALDDGALGQKKYAKWERPGKDGSIDSYC